jgi:hypothetical protein
MKLKVKVSNIANVEHRIRMGDEIESVAPGKSKTLELAQADFDRISHRAGLRLEVLPDDKAEKPAKAKAKT